MKVLIVGGAGYVGSLCGAHLVTHGVDVTVLDDLSTGHAPAAPGPLVIGDVRDGALLRRVLREGHFDAVMHFAARAVVPESVRRPSDTFSVNVGGTAALVDAMVEVG